MTVVALFGGSFDPPHLAHQVILLMALEATDVDSVWMVPAVRHAFRKSSVAFDHRVKMCELACAPFGQRVVVSDVERTLPGELVRTYDTVQALRSRHAGVDFRLLVGADILTETDRWHRWDDLVALAPPLVVGRTGYSPGDLPEPPAISSTEIRRRVAAGQSAVPLVSRAVMDYIDREGLYR